MSRIQSASAAGPDPAGRSGVVGVRRGGLQLATQLVGAPIRRPDGLGQDGPQAAALELRDGCRGRAARRGDHVAQLRRVHPARLGEGCAALERLDDQIVGDVAREAQMDGRVDERLHDQEHVRRPGAADGGRHGHELLVLDLELVTQAAEERRGLRALWLADRRRGVPHGHPLAQLGRCVGHGTHERLVAEDVGERPRGGAGDDADDQLAIPEHGCELGSDPLEHLGLDAQDHDVRALDGLDVRRRGADAVARFQLRPTLGARVAGDEAGGIDLARLEQPGDHRSGHDPGAHGRDGDVVQRHAPEYRCALRARGGPGAVAGPARYAMIGPCAPPRWATSTGDPRSIIPSSSPQPPSTPSWHGRGTGRRWPSWCSSRRATLGSRTRRRTWRRTTCPSTRRSTAWSSRALARARSASLQRPCAPTRGRTSTGSCVACSMCASARSCPWRPRSKRPGWRTAASRPSGCRVIGRCTSTPGSRMCPRPSSAAASGARSCCSRASSCAACRARPSSRGSPTTPRIAAEPGQPPGASASACTIPSTYPIISIDKHHRGWRAPTLPTGRCPDRSNPRPVDRICGHPSDRSRHVRALVGARDRHPRSTRAAPHQRARLPRHARLDRRTAPPGPRGLRHGTRRGGVRLGALPRDGERRAVVPGRVPVDAPRGRRRGRPDRVRRPGASRGTRCRRIAAVLQGRPRCGPTVPVAVPVGLGGAGPRGPPAAATSGRGAHRPPDVRAVRARAPCRGQGPRDPPGPRQPGVTALPITKKRGVLETATSTNPACSSAAASASGVRWTLTTRKVRPSARRRRDTPSTGIGSSSTGPDSGSGSESTKANRPPGRSHRRASPRKSGRRSSVTWLSQKPQNNPSTGASGSAHASRTWMWARSRCATSRSRARSRGSGLTSYSDSSPLPASSGDHQPVPAASSTIRPPKGCASSHAVALSSSMCHGRSRAGPRAVAAASEIPVVVVRGSGGVVGPHLGVESIERLVRGPGRAGRRVACGTACPLPERGTQPRIAGTRCPGRARGSRDTASPSRSGPTHPWRATLGRTRGSRRSTGRAPRDALAPSDRYPTDRSRDPASATSPEARSPPGPPGRTPPRASRCRR